MPSKKRNKGKSKSATPLKDTTPSENETSEEDVTLSNVATPSKEMGNSNDQSEEIAQLHAKLAAQTIAHDEMAKKHDEMTKKFDCLHDKIEAINNFQAKLMERMNARPAAAAALFSAEPTIAEKDQASQASPVKEESDDSASEYDEEVFKKAKVTLVAKQLMYTTRQWCAHSLCNLNCVD